MVADAENVPSRASYYDSPHIASEVTASAQSTGGHTGFGEHLTVPTTDTRTDHSGNRQRRMGEVDRPFDGSKLCVQ